MCLLYPITIPMACIHSCTLPLSSPHFPPPASYLLTRKDVFFTKSEFCQVISAMLHGKDARIKVDLPPPALWKVGRGVYGGMEGCGGVNVGVASDTHTVSTMRWDEGPWLSAYYSTSSSVLCACLNCCVCLFGGTAVYCTVFLQSILNCMLVLLTGVTGLVVLVCAPLCTHGVDLTSALLYVASIVVVHAHTLQV